MLQKRLSEEEIKNVLSKIKRKFDEYSKEYGEALFNYEAFRKRYLDFLKSRGNIEIFLFAEIGALEDKKNEIEEKREKRKRVKEAQEYLDKKGRDLFKPIEKYPEEEFHPKARFEIKKLVGVFKIIYDQLNHYHYDVAPDFKETYRQCLVDVRDFTLKPYSGNFKRYIEDLSNPMISPVKLEIQEQALLKEWGIILNTFVSILLRIKNNPEIEEFVQILDKISKDFRIKVFKPLV